MCGTVHCWDCPLPTIHKAQKLAKKEKKIARKKEEARLRNKKSFEVLDPFSHSALKILSSIYTVSFRDISCPALQNMTVRSDLYVDSLAVKIRTK